ncbi:MAG: hypothetical protein Q8O67_31460 [Deltaproteobacteria bacterium]|nr:hypothetical protein [Deltaproteobacteria bacterium]
MFAVFALLLVLPLDDALEPPVLDPAGDPAGDAPPEPAPPAPAPPAAAPTATTTPAPDAVLEWTPPALPDLQVLALPAILAAASAGAGGTALGALAMGEGVIGNQLDPTFAFVAIGLFLLAPAVGGLLAGTVALLFLKGVSLKEIGDMLTCTFMAWGSVFVLGGALGLNASSCLACGNYLDSPLYDGPANLVAGGAVIGAFVGVAVGLGVATSQRSDEYGAVVAMVAGMAIGAPLGALIPAIRVVSQQ